MLRKHPKLTLTGALGLLVVLCAVGIHCIIERSRSVKPATKTFIQAASAGDAEQVTALFEADPTIINRRDSYGRTALHRAASFGNEDIVEFLAIFFC